VNENQVKEAKRGGIFKFNLKLTMGFFCFGNILPDFLMTYITMFYNW